MLSFILDHRYISERNWTSLHHRTKSILLFDAAHDTAKLKSSPLLSDTDLSQQLTPRIASGSLSFPTLPGLCPMVSTNLVPGSCCPHKGHPCPGDCRWDKSELLEGHTNTALVSSQHPFRQESRLYPSIFNHSPSPIVEMASISFISVPHSVAGIISNTWTSCSHQERVGCVDPHRSAHPPIVAFDMYCLSLVCPQNSLPGWTLK